MLAPSKKKKIQARPLPTAFPFFDCNMQLFLIPPSDHVKYLSYNNHSEYYNK